MLLTADPNTTKVISVVEWNNKKPFREEGLFFCDIYRAGASPASILEQLSHYNFPEKSIFALTQTSASSRSAGCVLLVERVGRNRITRLEPYVRSDSLNQTRNFIQLYIAV